MTKLKFLFILRERLASLPQDEVEDRLSFYCEMIEDRIEEGLSEEEAVAAIGTIEEIVTQISSEINKSKTKTAKPKKSALEIFLLILGSPIWISLLISAFAIVLSLYVSLWAIVISLWTVFASLVGCSIGGILSGTYFLFSGNLYTGLALLFATAVCIGLSIFSFYTSKSVSKGTAKLTGVIVQSIKNRLTQRR